MKSVSAVFSIQAHHGRVAEKDEKFLEPTKRSDV